MKPSWIYLDARFGTGSIKTPTDEQIIDALADIYDEQRLDDVEEWRRDCWDAAYLRCGFEGDLRYEMTISEGSSSGGLVVLFKFEGWEDQPPVGRASEMTCPIRRHWSGGCSWHRDALRNSRRKWRSLLGW